MKIINYLIFFITSSLGNPMIEWIDQNESIFTNKFINASFDLNLKIDHSQSKHHIFFSNISVSDNNQFRFEIGPRIIVSNGKIWKSYDYRTDQIIIQSPDKKMEKAITLWTKLKKIKTMPLSKEIDGSYKVNLFGKENDIRIYFNSNKSLIDSIIVIKEKGYKSIISNILLSEADTVILEIGNKNSEIFDFR